MRKTRLLPRYLLLVAGLFFLGLGVGLTSRSGLGTSPISSLPLVASLILPISMGQWTFLLSVLFLLVQVALLGRRFEPIQLLQLAVGALFGLFVDLGLVLVAGVHPQAYPGRLLVLVLGCAALALGVHLQVIADVIINPGEGAVRTLARITGRQVGSVKVMFDATLVLVAVAVSLGAFHTVRGVREGAVLSAGLVGWMVNGIARTLQGFGPTRSWLEQLKA